VLAAGYGSRLRSAASGCPKPLREVRSVPLLVRVLRGLAQSGVTEAAVVLGHQADVIRKAITRAPALGLDVRFVLNESYDKSNGVSLLAARDFVGEECVLSMADHVYSPRVVEAVFESRFPVGTCVLGIDRDIERCFDLDDATKVRLEGERIVAISKTLSDYNALDTGVFRVGPAFVDALDAVYRERGDCSLSDGVQRLSREGRFFGSDVLGARWIDVDTPEAAREAARLIRVLGDDLEGVPRARRTGVTPPRPDPAGYALEPAADAE
jgi:choline kinase